MAAARGAPAANYSAGTVLCEYARRSYPQDPLCLSGVRLRPDGIRAVTGQMLDDMRGLDEIIVGRDGLYIEMPPHRGGLLLPQVASERGWNVDQFLRAVCHKAGYPDRAWELPEVRLYRFSAQVFGEE